ncbi:MAG: hypothetical protein J6M17_08980 [Ruminococcus sp.]|nr:hypothetical protein [Ruminococcus sp.]
MVFDIYIKKILKPLTLFVSGAFIYGLLEDIGRGFTHISMGVISGSAMLFIHMINKNVSSVTRVLFHSIISAYFITGAEFITGEILNIGLNMKIWDYTDMLFNIDGQICLLFSIIWFMLSFMASYIDILLCRIIFSENKNCLCTDTVNGAALFTKK